MQAAGTRYTLLKHVIIDPPQQILQSIGTQCQIVKTFSKHQSQLQPQRKKKQDSQFILKQSFIDALDKVLLDVDCYLVFNVGRAFVLGDFAWKYGALATSLFKDAFITCHHVNPLSLDTGIEVCIGFNTGDVLVLGILSGKYHRLNRNGSLHKYSVTCISWMPGSERLLLAAFSDGSLVLFDKEMDDQTVGIPPTADVYVLSKAPKLSKHNPRQYWKISRKSLTQLSFSPDGVHLAVTSMDGCLYIVDFGAGVILDVYQSYFGGLLCCAWSHDGVYIAAGFIVNKGGQDDLISIFAFKGRLVARCQGHLSWVRLVTQVSCLVFDPQNSSDKNYRIISGGHDTRIVFWDFDITAGLVRKKGNFLGGTLPRTRDERSNNLQNTNPASVSAGINVNGQVLGANTTGLGSRPLPNMHEFAGKRDAPMIEPIASEKVHQYSLSGIALKGDLLLTSDYLGNLFVWQSK